MYGALPSLQNLRGLEEQISEEEDGFKVIIWGWQATKGMKAEVSYNCCYLYICKFKKHYNQRFIQEHQV